MTRATIDPVVRRLLLFLSLAGCSFEARSASVSGDAAAGGEPPLIRDAAAVDAHVIVDAPPVHGSIAVTVADVPDGDINLSAEGTVDWAHWGAGSSYFDRKAGGSAISNAMRIGGSGTYAVPNVSVSASWVGGTPDASANATPTGIAVLSPAGLRITVPAGVHPQTLRVYTGLKYSDGRFDASLSDSSAGAFSDAESANSAKHYVYTIVFNAASDGQTLTATWTDTGDQSSTYSLTMLLSATLQ